MSDPSPASDAELEFAAIGGLPIDEFLKETDGLALSKAEWAQVLINVGRKYNYGLPAGAAVLPRQAAEFWRCLQLRELALAQACAKGGEEAWRQFLEQYREPLTQAALAITESATLGAELADSLFSEMFGLTSRDGERRSPLASYGGRGSLMGFLRTTLAQRHIDRHRRTHRETPLGEKDFAAVSGAPSPAPEVLTRLGASLAATLGTLDSEDRFLLSSWFLDQRPLHEIARVLHVHEATVSRKIKRLTDRLHKDLLQHLRQSGMSRHAAEEALGTDPRDLSINLRSLLQSSASRPFYQQGTVPEPENA